MVGISMLKRMSEVLDFSIFRESAMGKDLNVFDQEIPVGKVLSHASFFLSR